MHKPFESYVLYVILYRKLFKLFFLHIYFKVIFMTESKKEKKDSYTRVSVCQLIMCALLLLAVFSLKSDGMREDYGRIMSYTITKEDFTAIAETVKHYLLNESAVRDVFSESDTEKTTEEDSDEIPVEDFSEEDVLSDELYEETDAIGGADLKKSEVPYNCSFAPLKLTTPIISPVENGRYTSYFGFRVNPITEEYGFHTGLDIAAGKGTLIRAALSGTVEKVGEDSRAGKYIMLSHQKGLLTFYCHCSEILAEEGANIRQGETIALVGSTGMSTGPHLHFEIRKNNIRYDPLKVLQNAA